MKNIFLYTGTGAYQAKDLENFFAVFDIDYERLCEHDLKKLKPKDIFIVPGGQINEYLRTLSRKKILIRNFIKQGGIYIGICAGVYIAGTSFEGSQALGLVNKEFQYQEKKGLLKVQDENKNDINLIMENGPDLILEGRVILKDEAGTTRVLELDVGKGLIYLFAAHPEGSVYYKKYPDRFSGSQFFYNFLKSL